MRSESHIVPTSSYPRKPWLALVLALSFGPLGMAYTGMILSLTTLAIGVIINILVLSAFPSLISSYRYGLAQSIACGGLVYIYISHRHRIQFREKLAQFDRPTPIKWLAYVLASILLGLLFVNTVFTNVSSRSYGMYPTIAHGERVNIVLSSLLRGPMTHGTVVFFRSPVIEGRSVRLIYRVVALGGETVEVKKGLLYVNGKMADDPTRIARLRAAGCLESKSDINNLAYAGQNQGADGGRKLRIPAGHVYVLADNRAGPFSDSREFRAVPIANIAGVVQLNEHADLPVTAEGCLPPSSYGF
jgi:signal peptidase I